MELKKSTKNNLNLNFPIALILLVKCMISDARLEYGHCQNLFPQTRLDIEGITGMWYAVEILDHVRGDLGEKTYDVCPVIHISEVTSEVHKKQEESEYFHYNMHYRHGREREDRYLHIYWHEWYLTELSLLKFNNTNRGFWTDIEPSDCAEPEHHENHGPITPLYDEYPATIQVIKAVWNHMVLTFCKTHPEHNLYSIVFSRLPNNMTRDELLGLRHIFHWRNLSTISVKKVCTGSGSINSVQFLVATFICFVGFFVN